MQARVKNGNYDYANYELMIKEFLKVTKAIRKKYGMRDPENA